MGPLRRWKPLIAVAFVWVVGFWYFFADDPLPYGNPFATGPSSQLSGGGGDGLIRWRKHPDVYPVASPRPLPTGRPAAPIPSIQKTPPPLEDKEARRVRLERQAAVKASFQHSWKGYKDYAWLRDEVAPLSRNPKNTFGGWAATLVDALDTLWIMGLKDDFKAAVKACEKIDFSHTQSQSVNVFETTIRYLGGFLAAYEISERKFPALLKKAVEVAELLMCAFDTPNRMPISRWEWQA